MKRILFVGLLVLASARRLGQIERTSVQSYLNTDELSEIKSVSSTSEPALTQDSKDDDGIPTYGRVLIGLAAGAVLGALIPVFIGIALTLIGFTADGVLALSCAATCQGCYYGGATSGCFSVAQSIGAAGFHPCVFVCLAVVGEEVNEQKV